MLILLAMAGSVVAALVVGIYLSISVGEEEVPVFADEPSELSAGREVDAYPRSGRHADLADRLWRRH